MKRYPNYRIPIGYMLLYTPLILLSGVWLFVLSQGLDVTHRVGTALERLIDTPVPKSWQNLLEVAAPHLFSMGILIFIVAHFLLFSRRIAQRKSLQVSVAVMLLSLIDIGAYGAMIGGIIATGWIKLAAIFSFVLLFMLLLVMVAVSL